MYLLHSGQKEKKESDPVLSQRLRRKSAVWCKQSMSVAHALYGTTGEAYPEIGHLNEEVFRKARWLTHIFKKKAEIKRFYACLKSLTIALTISTVPM